MKTSSPLYHYLLMLFCITGIAVLACNQPAKVPVQPAQKTLKQLDKATLLKMVTNLNNVLSKKGSTANDGIKLLKAYAADYDFVIKGIPKHKPDTGYVFVNVVNETTYTLFDFGLPYALQKQITFANLKASYGPWTLSPLPKEPVTISSVFYLDKSNRVSININSKYLPEARENLIEQITVMRLNP